MLVQFQINDFYQKFMISDFYQQILATLLLSMNNNNIHQSHTNTKINEEYNCKLFESVCNILIWQKHKHVKYTIILRTRSGKLKF